MSQSVVCQAPIPSFEMTDEQIINLFLASYRDRSEYTIRNYRFAIERFRQFIYPKRLGDVQWTDIEDYKNALLTGRFTSEGRKLSSASAAVHLASIRSLYKWASDPNIGLLPHNPTTPIRLPRIHISDRNRYLTMNELEKLLAALKSQSNRNHLLGLMLALTGLRVSELVRLQWNDFQEAVMGSSIWLIVRRGKGGKSRDVKVPDILWEIILKYRNDQRLNPGEPSDNRVFPISVRQVDRILVKARKSCSLTKKATPHWFRHTSATLALLHGASLQQVQQSLGHTDITTTQRYLHTVEQIKKSAPDYVADSLKGFLESVEKK
ncbi:tyrosine-type recombinase/integrase [Cohnella suwonensis]|uniref:Tyrosine-type recombinase/integrase n=1 Tax=Cohnella suwonensis TaxID=696072 RepID=A0ABW0LRB4_9BACL